MLKKFFGDDTEEKKKELEQQFNELDRDGSDSLTWNELAGAGENQRLKLLGSEVISDAEYQKLVDMKQQYEVLLQTCKLSDGEASNWLGCSDAGPDAGVLVAAPPTVTLGEKQNIGFVAVKLKFSDEQSVELGGAEGIKTKLKKAFEQEDFKSCNKMVFTSPREDGKSPCDTDVPIVTGTKPKNAFLQCPRTCALLRACIHAETFPDDHPWYSGHCSPSADDRPRPNEDELKIAYKWDVHVDVDELPEAEEVAVKGKDPETAELERSTKDVEERQMQRFWTEATVRVVVPGARYTDAAIPNLPAD